jgi:hypothetical protein
MSSHTPGGTRTPGWRSPLYATEHHLPTRWLTCLIPPGVYCIAVLLCVLRSEPTAFHKSSLLFHCRPQQWHSAWVTRIPGINRRILGDTRRNLTSIKTKHGNRLNLEPALILALTKFRPHPVSGGISGPPCSWDI